METQLEESEIRIKNVRQQKISGNNIYQFPRCFDKLYDMLSNAEKKEFLSCFVESVEVYEEEQVDGRFLKCIKFCFPIFFNGEEVEELSLDNSSTIETAVQAVVVMSLSGAETH